MTLTETAPSEAHRQIDLARLRRKEGDRSASLAAFEQAMALDPSRLDIKVDAACELRALGRLDEAMAALDAVLAIKPKQFGALIERGHLERQRGDHAAALTSFEAAAEADPAHIGANVEVARSLRLLGRLDEASLRVSAALEAAPNHLGALIESGHIHRGRKDHVLALAAFMAGSAVDPNHLGVRLELAREFRALGRFDDAIGRLTAILVRNPENLAALIELALLHRQQGDAAGSLELFDRAAAVAPDHIGIMLERSRDLRALGRFDGAETALKQVLDREPVHVGALIDKGLLCRRRDKRDEALNLLEQAAKLRPDHPGLPMELAREYQAAGRTNEAEALLRRALVTDPGSLTSAVTLVQVLMEDYRLADARRVLEEVDGRHRDKARWMALHAQLARRQGDRATALRWFEAAVQASPDDLDLSIDLAAELREQGRFEDSESLLSTLVASHPDHYPTRLQLGYLYRAMDRRADARAVFADVVSRHPGEHQAHVELAHEDWAARNLNAAEARVTAVLEAEPTHIGALLTAAEFALQRENSEAALAIAERAIAARPRELGPYLIAARAAADRVDQPRALDLLNRAREACGARPEIIAAHLHILRRFQDHNTARALAAEEEAQQAARQNFNAWLECTTFAVGQGDFAAAEAALESAPASTWRERARLPFLRGQIADGRRRYTEAAAHYREAIGLDPTNGGWYGELARACLLQADMAGTREYLRAAIDRDAAARCARGLSLNLSQHHTGQLYEEFSFEPEALKAMLAAAQLPAAERIAPLSALVREFPDLTGPALLLVLAMRQAGHFDAPRPTTNVIPRRIVQYWNEELPPPDIAALIATWPAHNPDFEHLVFDDKRAATFLQARHGDAVLRAFLLAREPAQRADIFRLGYLATEGGVYVDADDCALGSLDAAVDFVGYQENYATIANNLLGAAPGHPVIAHALEKAVLAVNRGDRDIVWLMTGPGLITRAFAQVYTQPGGPRALHSTCLLELYEAQRLIGIHCPARYKKTNLHWGRAAFGPARNRN